MKKKLKERIEIIVFEFDNWVYANIQGGTYFNNANGYRQKVIKKLQSLIDKETKEALEKQKEKYYELGAKEVFKAVWGKNITEAILNLNDLNKRFHFSLDSLSDNQKENK